MPVIHHSAICVADIEVSLRFWRDGLGFESMMDESFVGDWPTLLHAPSNSLRSVFLGRPESPEAGIVELVDLDLGSDAQGPVDPPRPGFLLLSVMTDVSGTLERLAKLGLGGEPRRIEAMGTEMAVVTDPDGVLVELIDVGAAENLDTLFETDVT
jgi:catechol 2,3-dioxygenase-like lactoylglutathione lyase family enzyme